MKFIINRELLLVTLQNVSRGLSDKKPFPVLTGIQITVEKHRIVFVTTNKDISVQIILEENNDVTIQETGACVVPGKYFLEIIKKLEGKDVATTPFEIHKKYLDIHVDISGCEIIQTGDMGHAKETSFDENRDFGIVECENKVTSYMSPEDFYICMLDEPHKPACAASEDKAIKKCVFKILV